MLAQEHLQYLQVHLVSDQGINHATQCSPSAHNSVRTVKSSSAGPMATNTGALPRAATSLLMLTSHTSSRMQHQSKSVCTREAL